MTNEVVNAKTKKVVEHMIAIRDQRDALKREFEAADKLLRDKYEKGENYLRITLQEMGVDSIKMTGVGTVFTSQRLKASVGDREAFKQFLASTGEFDLMEFRVSTTNLKLYMEANDNALPPGVTAHTDRTLNIRRA